MNVTIRSAPLPVSYQEARNALAKCLRIDECKKWAAKAQALASYARQMNDDALFKAAQRIQDRAMIRTGELLREIEAEQPGRPKNDLAGKSISMRKQAAKDAGLSPNQAADAIAAAKVPAEEADALIESDNPPTPTLLAELGRKKRVMPQAHSREFGLWTSAIKDLRDLPACGLETLAKVEGGLSRQRLVADARAAITNIDLWIATVEEHGHDYAVAQKP